MIENSNNNENPNYATHNIRSAKKMSPTTTKRSKNSSSSIIIIDNTRSRFSLLNRTLLSTLLVTLLLIQLLATQTHASASASAFAFVPDYDDPEDQLQLHGGDTFSNDEIHDPAQLQQAVEAIDNIHSDMERMDVETESSPLLLHDEERINVSQNRIAKEETQRQEMESATPPQQQQKQEEQQQRKQQQRNSDTRESNNEEFNETDSTDTIYDGVTEQVPTVATTTTNMMHLYLRRKPKADGYRSTTTAPDEDDDDDVDEAVGRVAPHADYPKTYDEMLNASTYQGNSKQEAMPLAMKFYQTADDSLNNAQQQHRPPARSAMHLLQEELLRKQHLEQPQQFYNHSDEGGEDGDDEEEERDEYYNHSSDESNFEQLAKHHKMKMITRTTAPTTTAPATLEATPTFTPIFDIIEGLKPGFLRSTTTRSHGTIAVTLDASDYPTTTTTTLKSKPPASMATITTTAPTTTSPPLSPPTTRTTTQITRPAAGNKQGKQIIISPRKLMPHEQLRNYIEDAYIRMPLAVIVDPSAESLEKTKALWRDAMRTNLNIKIVLVALNSSGVPVAYSFNNTRQFLDGLNSIQENEGGDSFIGILHASELVPFDSAVFISTAGLPPHTELVQDAAITLLKKRIRLYLMWYGERSISENETQEALGGILGEVAIRSGGDVLHIVGNETAQELESNTLALVANSFRGPQDFDLPVDTTFSNIHIKIDSPMRVATLETPNGDINLKKVAKFKSRVFTFGSDDKRLDAYVPLTKLRKTAFYKLLLIPESLYADYKVFVRANRRAESFLDDMIQNLDSYSLNSLSTNLTKSREGRLSSETSAVIKKTHENLKFPEDTTKEEGPKSEVETFSETELTKIVNNNNNHNNTVLDINNSDGSISENQRATNHLQLSLTKIEMGIQSQVLVSPGIMAQLYFEITNPRTETVYHTIEVVDEKSYLQRLSEQSVRLAAGATSTVTVTVGVPTGTPHGTLDRITFTCHGSQSVSLSVNLKVTTSVDAQDTIEPEVSWTFGSRCENIDSNAASCADRFWVLNIIAQDWQTGILRLQTTPPKGLIYRNAYTVGSTEALRASYVATCCHPKVSLLAHDVAGNQKAVTVDVRDLILTEASIAAIILGVLLIIVLIVLLIISIVWCCRRRKMTLDLPTYRSHSTRNID